MEVEIKKSRRIYRSAPGKEVEKSKENFQGRRVLYNVIDEETGEEKLINKIYGSDDIPFGATFEDIHKKLIEIEEAKKAAKEEEIDSEEEITTEEE